MALAYKLLKDNMGIEMDDEGRPIVIDDTDDKTFGLDAIHLYSKIPGLQAEAKKYREGFADLEPEDVRNKLNTFDEVQAKLSAFGDIDPEAAKEALQTVANLGDLDKDKNIEISKVKAGVAESYEAKIRDIDAANEQKMAAVTDSLTKKDQVIRNLLIRGAFDRSEFIRDKTVLTPDIAYDSFGKFFRIEEDNDNVKVFALDRKGDKIFSKANPGEYASTEEAIGLIISGYPQKDSILRSNSGGSGAGGNRNVTSGKRAKLDALKLMNPAERLNEMRKLA